jgi:nucleotide-binding universal stress UspA family protein
MKTVFIAIDFSEASHHAALYGVELANLLEARVVLFNAYQIPLTAAEAYVVVKPEEVRQAAMDYLSDEVVTLRKSSIYPIEIVTDEGNSPEVIIRNAKKFKDPLIVVGMKGAGKGVRNLFGSTVSGLARKTDLPVLVIPEEAIFNPIKRMAMAYDLKPELDMASLHPMLELIAASQSKLYLIHVLKANADVVQELSYRSSRLSDKLKNTDYEYRFPRSNDVVEGIEEFVEDVQIDMLAVMPQHHSFLQKIFFPSDTRKLIFHTRIPLLVLPEKLRAHQDAPSKKLQKQKF